MMLLHRTSTMHDTREGWQSVKLVFPANHGNESLSVKLPFGAKKKAGRTEMQSRGGESLQLRASAAKKVSQSTAVART